MFSFLDKVIVVTGAAGNLGQAVVTELLEAGGSVCAVDHCQGRLVSLFPEGRGQLKIYEGVNSADRQRMVALAEQIQAEFGSVDILINTVGGFTMGERVDEISTETWQRMFDINVISFMNAAAAFVPGMIAAGHGKIVTIGSGAALKGTARMGAYAAAKAALLRLTESLAEEMKSSQIQVNCVLPGTIDTPQNREAMPNADFSKWVKPQQLAEAILFLSSPASDAISGAAVPVYGR